MSRRVIQPPGGASQIFFGDGSGDAKKPVKAPVEEPKKEEDTSAHKSTEAANGNGQSTGGGHYSNETAGEAAVINKASQAGRGYNLITGESDADTASHRSSRPAPAQAKKPEAAGFDGGHSKPDTTTSIKVHHPPGGKSSGPLW